MAGIFKQLFACLTCSSSSHPSSSESHSSARGTNGAAPGNPPAEHAQGAPKRQSQPLQQARSTQPYNSRRSSRVQLDLPLEYVNLEQADHNDPAQEIIGRKSAYSVAGAGEQISGDAYSGKFFVQASPTPTRSVSTASSIHDGTPPHSPSGSSVSEFPLSDRVEPEGGDAQPEGPLLPPVDPLLQDRKCLVLDLDETLVHSSFKYIPDADFVIPVEIEGRVHNVFVVKRPGVDEFLERVGSLFEVVVFTASVAKYGDPLLDHLDTKSVVHHRLFRESCYNFNGNYLKNLSQLGRSLKDVIIIDNSPASYALQPQHAVPVSSWFSDNHDNELLDMIPFLSDLADRNVHDVSNVLDVSIE